MYDTTDLTCSCCGMQTIPPTPGTDEEGFYCEGCGTAWVTPHGMSPMSCLMHRPHERESEKE